MLKLTFAIIAIAIVVGISVLMEGHNFFVSVMLATLLQIAAVVILYLIYTIIDYKNQTNKKCPCCQAPMYPKQNHILKCVDLLCTKCNHREIIC